MKRTPRMLRTTVGTFTVVGITFSVTVCGALVALTFIIHETTSDVAAGIESVHLAQQAQMDLLLLARERDPVARRETANDIQEEFVQMRRYTTTDTEARALRRAESALHTLVAHMEQGRGFEPEESAVYGALTTLAEINLAQAREASERASLWNDVAFLVGGASVLVVTVVGFGLHWWVRRRVFRPVLALGSAMLRFAKGETSARASEEGPGEMRDMARRFNEMASVLAAQRAAQNAFLGGVAHDLRSPLMTLKMAVGLLPDDDPGISLRVERQIDRMERMIADFLDASKIEAGQLALRLETVDARRLAADVVNLFDASVSGHTILMHLPTDAVTLRCDPMRIGQVMTNLVSNAVKYSPRGGLVDVSLRRVGREAIFEVSDEGVGISEDDQRHLFEPFRRVGLSKESIPSVGLGLFVCRQIVEAHGGRIELTSAPGKGATFRVFLETVRRAEAVEAEAPAGAPLPSA